MKTNLIYTNLNTEELESKKIIYRLMNAKTSIRMSDAVGKTIDVAAFIIFERVYTVEEGTEHVTTVIMIEDKEGVIYGTTSASFIDSIVNYIEAGFDPESIEKIDVGTARSKKGREFLTADIT